MGLFTTSRYSMAVLPFITGVVADGAGFFVAFVVTVVVRG